MTRAPSTGRPAAPKGDPEPPFDLGGLEREVGFMLRAAERGLFPDLVRTLEEFDLRPGEYALLKVIAANPGSLQQKIREAVNMQPSNITPMIERLERRGLIVKTRDENDRRAQRLSLTTLGAKMIPRIRAAQAGQERRLEALLGRETLEIVLAALTKLSKL